MEIQPKVVRRPVTMQRMSLGRGFSKSELKEVGLSSSTARRLGIVTDDRRKTKHQVNVDSLQEMLKTTGKSIPELVKEADPTRIRFTSGPHYGRAQRGLTSSGKRMRGLLRSRGSRGTRGYKFKKLKR